MISDESNQVSYNLKKTEKLFIEVAKKYTPVKTPIIPEKAWVRLLKEINIKKEKEKRIEEFDAENIDAVVEAIKEGAKNKDILSSIIYDFRDHYKTKKAIVPNADKIKKVIKELLSSSINNKDLGISLLLFFVKKDKDLFESLVQKYIKQNKKYFQNCPEEHTIGELGKINPKWVQDLIPVMIKALKQNPEWNTRRFMAFNLGSIGSKYPECVEEAVPIMVDYIKKPAKIKARGVVIEISVSGVDETQWLKDAYIDSLGMIAKGDKSLIEPHISLFARIAKKDKSEYSRKKAQKVLDVLK